MRPLSIREKAGQHRPRRSKSNDQFHQVRAVPCHCQAGPAVTSWGREVRAEKGQARQTDKCAASPKVGRASD